ncbi:MAG: glycoside hydrolase family 15 protein [Candidatus Binataceae bacterium]
MSLPIEDYAIIGNLQTAALSARSGSIDWLCVPRFDSPACFAALLGASEHGRWLIAPEVTVKQVRRRYRGESLVLETVFETADGEAALIDFMPIDQLTGQTAVVRLVEGRKGSVPMRMELIVRFGYGRVAPEVERTGQSWRAVAGPDRISLDTEVKTHIEDPMTVARFTVTQGETIPFVLNYGNPEIPTIEAGDALSLLEKAESWWMQWVAQCGYRGTYQKEVARSVITLRALTYRPTGAIIAAPTTSLPELLKGSLNWDYRYCWLRDASYTLCALLVSGFREEAIAWRQWLIRVVAGQAGRIQTVYGLAGERLLEESELANLPGYDSSLPVRVGNAAYKQLQLDIYGEVLNAIYIAHQYDIAIGEDEWRMLCTFLRFLESIWEEPDDGIWETRSGARHFTESKVAAWMAFDRAVKLIERDNFMGPLESWRHLRDKIHADVCKRGFDSKRNSFVQRYGASDIDASLLRLPLMGFLPANDSRIAGTIEAIQSGLMEDGLIKRTRDAIDSGEGAFLPCNFWLVDCLITLGRNDQARKLYERLLQLCNDAGLLSEEFDPARGRMLGNFPQALTHLSLVISAFNLLPEQKPIKLMRGEF